MAVYEPGSGVSPDAECAQEPGETPGAWTQCAGVLEQCDIHYYHLQATPTPWCSVKADLTD